MRGLAKFVRSLGVARKATSTKSSHMSLQWSRGIFTAGNIVHSDLTDVNIPEENIADFVWHRHLKDQQPNKLALADGVTGKKVTFSEARSLSRSFGSSLVRMGYGQGDVIALLLHNCTEYPVLMIGVAGIGATVTTINPAYTAGEIRRQLVGSNAKMVVTCPEMMEKCLDAAEGMDVQVVVDGAGGANKKVLPLNSMLADSGDQYPDNLDLDVHSSIVDLPYSSGTTGVPKGVMLTHKNMVANIAQLNHPETQILQEGQTSLVVMPMFHIYGTMLFLNSITMMGTLISLPSFDPDTFLKALLEHRPNVLPLVPPLVGFLALHPDVTGEHLASVQTVSVGAAPLGKALIDKFHERAPHVDFCEGYGMSECQVVTFTRKDHIVEGAAGQLLPNTKMKVVDLTSGEPLGPEESGELCFHGPQVMPGYLDNQVATQHTIIDGWVNTGDIGYYDKEGNVYIVDRLKELIKVKGLQVAPAELEDTIRMMPGVNDVAVIGIDHPRNGEAPRAYVVKGSQDITEEQVKKFVALHLSAHKHLAGGVEFVAEIPKSAAGKILRKDIKAKYLQSVN